MKRYLYETALVDTLCEAQNSGRPFEAVSDYELSEIARRKERHLQYKQDTPNDQIISFVQAIEGFAGNIHDGIYDQDKCKQKAWLIVEYGQEIALLARMPQGQFNKARRGDAV